MSRSIGARLARLESGATEPEIYVWCDSPDQVDETIEAMIAEGRIRPDQRAYCVFWERASSAPGTHEQMLDQL
jgi:hypothetical protein